MVVWFEGSYGPQAMETAADMTALAASRAREQHALANENHGERTAAGVLTDRADAIRLRYIAALALPTHPKANAEPLGSV